MSELTKDAIEIFLKHLTDRVALGVLLLSLILLVSMVIPGSGGNWARNHATWVAFGILGPLCYLPTRFLLEKVSEWQAVRARHKRLENLTPREQEILGPYIRSDYRTRRFLQTDPVAKGLADDGVLYCPQVPRTQDGKDAYNIQDWARKYLKSHPNSLGKFDDKKITDEGDC